MNTTVPVARALQQGLALLRRLGDGEPQPLERLAAAAGLAKSSALRLLRTLEAEGLVARDPASRAFVARGRITALPDRLLLADEVGHRLGELCRDTGCTAEWWVAGADGMVLADRRTAPDSELVIAARPGFAYPRDRLEAVPALEHACFRGDAFPAATMTWETDGSARRASAAERAEALRRARSGRFQDLRGNGRGIRRLAARVGERWVLALAVLAHPPAGDLERRHGRAFTRHWQGLDLAHRSAP